MKKLISLLALFIPIIIFAQVPQGISYQAIALDSSGNPIVNSNVGIRLSVLDNSATGTVLYSETHLKTTTALGLFNLVIGQGITDTGNFSTINWGNSAKFLKSEIDVAGGTDYVLVGTTQLLSVPYALTAGSLSGPGSNDSIEDNKTSNFAFASTSGIVYAFNSATDTWVGQSGTVNSNVGLIQSNKNVAFASSEGTVYAFNSATNNWIGQSGLIMNTGLRESNGNFAFGSSDGNMYVFNKDNGTWSSHPGLTSYFTGSGGNFAFASTDGIVSVYNAKTNTWASQTGIVVENTYIPHSNGNFAFQSTDGHVYAYNKNTGLWVGQSAIVNNTFGLVLLESN